MLLRVRCLSLLTDLRWLPGGPAPLNLSAQVFEVGVVASCLLAIPLQVLLAPPVRLQSSGRVLLLLPAGLKKQIKTKQKKHGSAAQRPGEAETD